MAKARDVGAEVQAFFHELAVSIKSPHYGDAQKQLVESLLKLATTAQLYHPENP